jgi:hypothetical protein
MKFELNWSDLKTNDEKWPRVTLVTTLGQAMKNTPLILAYGLKVKRSHHGGTEKIKIKITKKGMLFLLVF